MRLGPGGPAPASPGECPHQRFLGGVVGIRVAAAQEERITLQHAAAVVSQRGHRLHQSGVPASAFSSTAIGRTTTVKRSVLLSTS
jgi:hypothetical protein